MAQHEKLESICSTQRMDFVITIVSKGKGETVLDLLRDNGIFQSTICHGRGTAPSSVLEMLGLGATEKDVVICVVKYERSHEILKLISKKIDFAKPGHGIAFTVPIESVAGIMAFKLLTAEYPEED